MALPHGDFTTLTAVRLAVLQQGVSSTIDTDDDALLKQYIAAASTLIARHTGRTFTPFYQARAHDYRDPYVLNLDTDLLELASLTNGDAASIATSAVLLLSANIYPKWRLKIKNSSGLAFTYQDDAEQALTVTGWWGYHSDYDRAFVNTLETVPVGDLASGATSFTATDADGLDALGRQRFEDGQLLRIDNELIKVVGVNASTNVITIRRAQLGTTAAAHTAATAISSWRVLADVELQCQRLVLWAYKRRDSVQSITFLDTNVTLRDDTLREIFGILSNYQPVRVYGVEP